MTDQATDYSNERAADIAGDRIKDASETVQHVASGVAEQARQYGEKAQDAARQFKPFVERSLKDQPTATLCGRGRDWLCSGSALEKVEQDSAVRIPMSPCLSARPKGSGVTTARCWPRMASLRPVFA
jgi:hypothetical protein